MTHACRGRIPYSCWRGVLGAWLWLAGCSDMNRPSGSFLADRYLGKYWTIVSFAVPYVFGPILLGIPIPLVYYLALGILAIGTGVIKPNISTLDGQILLTAQVPPRTLSDTQSTRGGAVDNIWPNPTSETSPGRSRCPAASLSRWQHAARSSAPCRRSSARTRGTAARGRAASG